MTCDLKRLYLLIVAWVWKLTMCVTHCCILFGLGPRHANSDFFSRNQQLVLARPELTLDKHEPISCCSCCSTQFHLMYVYNNETMLGVQASATSFQWIRPTKAPGMWPCTHNLWKLSQKYCYIIIPLHSVQFECWDLVKQSKYWLDVLIQHTRRQPYK